MWYNVKSFNVSFSAVKLQDVALKTTKSLKWGGGAEE
jgi:hypothetical protein